MNIFYALITSFLAGLSTIIGGLFIFLNIKEKNINKIITLFLTMAIVIMIGISITELIPKSLLFLHRNTNYWFLIMIVIIFLSYIFIKLINSMFKNVNNNLYKVGYISMIILAIHNFPEGIITFMTSTINPLLGIKIAVSIALHNIPEGMIIGIPIFYATQSRKKAILATALSGLAEPMGAIITYLFLYRIINNIIIYIILFFVGCIMIIISINELYPQMIKYKEYKYVLYGIIIGITLLVASSLI